MVTDQRTGEADRRRGGDRRRGNTRRQRAMVTLIVLCFLALVVGNVLAYVEANSAGNTADLADTEARAALASLADERFKSCQADELDRARERAIGAMFPQANLPPVPPPRDCLEEARKLERSIEALFTIAAGSEAEGDMRPEGTATPPPATTNPDP